MGGGSVGGSSGTGSTGGGVRTGGGFGRRRAKTGSGDGSGSGSDLFVPGSDGNLSWNGTKPIAGKPILLYVFDGHIYDGSAFDYSKRLETELFKHKDVIQAARDFICEKVCIGDHEFLRKVKGREPVTEYLATTFEKPESRKVKLLFLDATGKAIAAFDDPKALKEGVPALLAQLREAAKVNAQRLAELPDAGTPADAADAKDGVGSAPVAPAKEPRADG